MDATSVKLRPLDAPDEQAARVAVAAVRRLHQRTLATWAGDALQLRRSGASQATWSTDSLRRVA